MKRRSKAKTAALFARNYGAESHIIRLMPCAVPRCRYGPIECAHHPSRGASGGRFDQGPLCRTHHAEQSGGVQTFQAKYSIDLRALWDEIAVGHERPLGLRGVADLWISCDPPADYERGAVVGWVRRAGHRGLDLRAIAEALDVDEGFAAALVEAAE